MVHSLPPDHDQRLAAADPAHSVLLTAPAGSGKTSVLLLRFLRCLLCVQQPEQVVAITFTNKAAAEIRVRVAAALSQAATPLAADANAFDIEIHRAASAVIDRDAGLGWQLQHDTARLRIHTIDSFCGSIVQRLPLLSGLGSAAPTDDDQRLFKDAVLSLMRSWQVGSLTAEDAAALARILAYGDNRYDRLEPMLSGLLARRDQWLEPVLGARDDAAQVLHDVVTAEFSQLYDALVSVGFADLVARLQGLPADDPHWGFAAALPDFSAITVDHLPLLRRIASGLTKADGLLYSPDSLHHGGRGKLPRGDAATEAVREWVAGRLDAGEAAPVESLLARIRSLPDAQMPAGTAQLNRDLRRVLRLLVAHLQITFAAAGETDFSETALRAIQALGGDTDVDPDALLREARIEHLLIDEMQDTSARQIQLTETLCSNWLPDDGRSIFLCGDLMQSIYGFRGAQPQRFRALATAGTFAQRPLVQLALSANFRSAPELVNWCNARFEMLTAKDSQRAFVAAQPQRALSGEVSVHGFVADAIDAGESAEVQRCIDIIREALGADPASPPTIAVLVRARGQLSRLIDALREAGIAFSSRNAELLQHTPPIRGLLHLLWALWHDADDVAWVGVLREPFVGLGWEDIRRLRHSGVCVRDAIADAEVVAALSDEGQARCRRLRDVLQRCDNSDMAPHLGLHLAAVWHSLAAPALLRDEELVAVERFFRLLNDCLRGGVLQSRSEFERRLEKLHAAPVGGQVQLMSMHSAKGLEYDVVILPQLGRRGRSDSKPLFHTRAFDQGEVMAAQPLAVEQSGDATAQQRLFDFLGEAAKDDRRMDELRLLYVACTRARRSLHLLATAIDKDGELKPQSGSMLDMLWPVLADDFGSATRVDAQHDADASDDWVHVIAPRIDINARVECSAGVAPQQRASSGLERIELQQTLAGLEENITARATGLVYHELMDRLARELAVGVNHQRLDGDHWHRVVRARLRHHCHPVAEIEASIARVLLLANNTLQCPKGRWLLDRSGQAWNEQPVLARHGDLWRRLIFDRLFIDGDTCWIIDYKTAGEATDDVHTAAAEAARYAAKMSRYRDAAREAGVAPLVCAALYFPAFQQLYVYED